MVSGVNASLNTNTQGQEGADEWQMSSAAGGEIATSGGAGTSPEFLRFFNSDRFVFSSAGGENLRHSSVFYTDYRPQM